MKHAVSVVIPAFNAADTIEDCLRSVMTQTDVDVDRILVVDDGSDDGTAELIQALDCDVVRQKNAGPSAARNRGIWEVSSPLIAFLDADDIFLPGALSTRMTAIGSCDLLMTRGLGRKPRQGNISPSRVDLLTVARRLGGIRSPSGWIAKRSSLVSAGGFREELRCLEDVELVMRMSALGYEVFISDDETYDYRWSPRTRRPLLGEGLLVLAESMSLDECWEGALNTATRRLIARRYLRHAMNVFAREGDTESMQRTWVQAETLGISRSFDLALAARWPRAWATGVRIRHSL